MAKTNLVFLVEEFNYEERKLLGCFSTREGAEAKVAKLTRKPALAMEMLPLTEKEAERVRGGKKVEPKMSFTKVPWILVRKGLWESDRGRSIQITQLRLQ